MALPTTRIQLPTGSLLCGARFTAAQSEIAALDPIVLQSTAGQNDADEGPIDDPQRPAASQAFRDLAPRRIVMVRQEAADVHIVVGL